MFDLIFGNYLMSTGKISNNQFKDLMEYESKVRVKLGLIAVAEKLMTQEQADEVNALQATMDKRFGDIAVEQGYLTDDQVGQLLKKQGNVYMLFVQTLIDNNVMTLEEIEAALAEYQKQQGFTHSDMDDLVSGDIDRTVKLFLPQNTELCDRLCGIVVRTIIRLVNSQAFVSKAYFVDSISFDHFAMQAIKGDNSIITGFGANGDALLQIANPFAQEEFESVDMDALDSVAEFTNCVNGLFASELSTEGVDIDMLPPEFDEKAVTVTGDQFCVLPITFDSDKVVNLVLAIDSELTIS